MKKIIPMLAAIGVMFGASSAVADAPVTLQMLNRTDGAAVEITADASPELKNNRVMVPFRVISEHLGATVHWSNQEVVLIKGGTRVSLRLGSDMAVVNRETVRLDAVPYVKNDRMMVPLRFVAEVFGCDVRYENHTVTVAMKPFAIDGVDVTTFRLETAVIDGFVVEDVVGNSYFEEIYRTIEAGKGGKAEPPARAVPEYGLAEPGDFYPMAKYDFLDRDGSSIRHYDVYARRLAEDAPAPGHYLLYAAHEDQWYAFDPEAPYKIWNVKGTAVKHGYGSIVENDGSRQDRTGSGRG